MKAAAKTATPHARGSTRVEREKQAIIQGYPACAGIDLARFRIALTSRWLPRMRGDRPTAEDVVARALEATPHARGSTLIGAKVTGSGCGYPACAGIDLAL